MKNYPSEAEVAALRALYPKGTRIELVYMGDVFAVEPGTKGTVVMVDDIGQIQMHWDNGRGLALVPGTDCFVKIEKEEEMER